MDVRIEHHYDHHHGPHHFAAVLLRDGEPWYLDGALVGMGNTPAGAVTDLEQLARYVVLYGQNALMEQPLEYPDLEWLFNQIHPLAPDLECTPMHEAIAKARERDTDRRRSLWHWHGMDYRQYDMMMEEQDHRCYLCGRILPDNPKHRHLDHDHNCCPPGDSCPMCRRGITDAACNQIIGLADYDPERLHRIADNFAAAQRRLAEEASLQWPS
jgi:hypothetical protein